MELRRFTACHGFAFAARAMLRAMVVHLLRVQLLDVLHFLAFAAQVVVAVVALVPYAPQLLHDASLPPELLQHVFWVSVLRHHRLSPVADDECVFGA